MKVDIGNHSFPVEITRKNNKNIYFRFKNDVLYVTCNRFVSEREIIRLINNNQKSLINMYNKIKIKEKNDVGFHYLGKLVTIVYDENIKSPVIEDDIFYFKNEKQFAKWYKEECLKVFADRLDYLLPRFTNLPKFTFKIRKMTSRWGVNNVTKKIITLNTELLKKSIDLIDYVIIHELCHFYEGNHSNRFWYQVSLRYPNYKEARKRLRVE